MSGEPFTLKFSVCSATIFLLFDFLFSTVTRLQSDAISYLFQLFATLLALAACLWRAKVAATPFRAMWGLLAAGVGLSACGVVLAAWEALFIHRPFQVASLSDFAFFFFGVPILLAISTPVEGLRSPIFTYLNGVQAVFAGLLTYVAIFSTLPLSKSGAHPVSISLLVMTYDVENLLLAASCLVRFVAAPKGSDERAFYRILFAFLATFGIGVLIYDHHAAATNGSPAFSFLVDVSYLLLAILAVRLPARGNESSLAPVRKGLLALFVDNASPIFFTLALLVLILQVLPKRTHLGMAAVGVTLGAYGIRTTLMQIRIIRSQRQLQEARDRMEEISLQDGLTGIANRRSFDQTLVSEWYRAMRAEHPLTLLLIDLDYFKSLNDTQGHRSGDRCLIEVAGALRAVASRSGDLVARYGGEEFAVILPATTHEAARGLAQKIQDVLRTLEIRNETPTGEYLTVSIGIATQVFPGEGSIDALVEDSDRALYKAKRSGRNRVEYCSSQSLPMITPIESSSSVGRASLPMAQA